jgi:hypothetical protein
MLGKIVKTAALVAMIGVGTAAATTGQAAAAGGFGFSIEVGPGWGSGPGYGWGPGYGSRPHRGICKPRRAVKKARHMGVRSGRIVRRNHRRVVVRGWRRGYPVRVVFANRRHCPVIALR